MAKSPEEEKKKKKKQHAILGTTAAIGSVPVLRAAGGVPINRITESALKRPFTVDDFNSRSGLFSKFLEDHPDVMPRVTPVRDADRSGNSKLFYSPHERIINVRGVKVPLKNNQGVITGSRTYADTRFLGGIAHEMGHADVDKKLNMTDLNHGLYSLGHMGPIAPLAAASIPAVLQNKRHARIAASVAGLLSLPMLANEIGASAYGYKRLGAMSDLTWRDKIKAFSGVPTYAASAAAPLLAYKVKDMLHGYDEEEDTRKTASVSTPPVPMEKIISIINKLAGANRPHMPVNRIKVASLLAKLSGVVDKLRHSGKGRSWDNGDPEQKRIGIEVEQEHVSGDEFSDKQKVDMAKEIVRDHLKEDPEYYTHLMEMEQKVKRSPTNGLTFGG